MDKRKRIYAPGYRVLKALCDPLLDRIIALEASEIRAASTALDQLNEGNCSWFVYELRSVLSLRLTQWRWERLRMECPGCGVEAFGRVNAALKPHAAEFRCQDEKCRHQKWLTRREFARLELAADRYWKGKGRRG